MKAYYYPILLILYLLPLCWLLFFYSDADYSRLHSPHLAEPNFVPFKTITHFIEYYLNGNHGWQVRWSYIKNVVGNIILFIPLGSLLFINFSIFLKRKRVAFTTYLMIILIVELIQWVGRLGVFDIDDIILNTTGLALGHFMSTYVSLGSESAKSKL